MQRGHIAWRCLDCSYGKVTGVPGAVELEEVPEFWEAVYGVTPFRINCMVRSLVTFYIRCVTKNVACLPEAVLSLAEAL